MVLKEDFYYPPADSGRKLHIWLPDDYETSGASYPVMYFFDGHNLYDDRDATFGKSWGFVPYLRGWDRDLIMIGMECSHEGNARLFEYMPYQRETGFFSEAPCLGDATFRWILEEIKPWADKRFRTLPDRAHTGIGGSSMGGLMALYGGSHYNSSFSRAACVSPSIPFCLPSVLKDLDQAEILPDSRFFLSFGSREAGGASDPEREDKRTYTYRCVRAAENRLKKKGASAWLYCQEGGGHCEADWEKQIPLFMPWLWQD